MFSKKTLFVVGAGASLPYGYPLGDDLVGMIIKKCEKSIDPDHKKLLDLIVLHEPFSIDSFLACHCDEELQMVGKELIVQCILECEDRERLDKGRQIKKFKEAESKYTANDLISANWYRYLTNAMLADIKSLEDETKELPFMIITFNYDVSLEYYLIDRLLKAPLLEKKEVIFKKLKKSIVHVYGSVRNTDAWWDNPHYVEWSDEKRTATISSGNAMKSQEYDTLKNSAFGVNDETKRVEYCYGGFRLKTHIGNDLIQVSESDEAKTFAIERTKNTSHNFLKVISQERNEKVEASLKPFQQFTIAEAQRITFLGFGFDNTNMDLLFPEQMRFLLNMSQTDEVDFSVLIHEITHSMQPITENIKLKNIKETLLWLYPQYQDYEKDTALKDDFVKLLQHILDNSKKVKELQYTNYGNSEKLNQRIKDRFPENGGFKHFPSTKDVYGALMYDFDL